MIFALGLVVCPGGFYVPLLGIEIIDGGSCGVICPPDIVGDARIVIT